MSSKSSMRIVLVDPRGDVLFSGESLSALRREAHEAHEAHEPHGPREPVAAPPDSSEAVTERCPQTLRSPEGSESGIYRTVDRARALVADDAPETEDAPAIEDSGVQIRQGTAGRGSRVA